MALFNILKGLYVSVNKRSRGDGRQCEVWKVSVWLLGNRTKHIKPLDKQAVNGFQSGKLRVRNLGNQEFDFFFFLFQHLCDHTSL